MDNQTKTLIAKAASKYALKLSGAMLAAPINWVHTFNVLLRGRNNPWLQGITIGTTETILEAMNGVFQDLGLPIDEEDKKILDMLAKEGIKDVNEMVEEMSQERTILGRCTIMVRYYKDSYEKGVRRAEEIKNRGLERMTSTIKDKIQKGEYSTVNGVFGKN